MAKTRTENPILDALLEATGHAISPDMQENSTVLPEAEAHDLVVRFKRPQDTITFNVGDLVTFRPDLRGTCRYPLPGRPAIVTHVRHGRPPDHVYDVGISAADHDEQRQINYCDIVLGVIINGQFVEFGADSRRLDVWVPPSMPAKANQ